MVEKIDYGDLFLGTKANKPVDALYRVLATNEFGQVGQDVDLSIDNRYRFMYNIISKQYHNEDTNCFLYTMRFIGSNYITEEYHCSACGRNIDYIDAYCKYCSSKNKLPSFYLERVE